MPLIALILFLVLALLVFGVGHIAVHLVWLAIVVAFFIFIFTVIFGAVL